ncbi:LAFA_0B03950g1_1 [Lachancea sp. 'fantastica']|nr:LAFA_0B03950g1_1 [Lachancea sp. 'fantastica']
MSVLSDSAAKCAKESERWPNDDPVLIQVTQNIQDIHLDDEGVGDSEKRAIYLSYDEAISCNKNKRTKAAFQSSYEFCLKGLKRKWGTWNENRPFSLYGIPKNNIISLDWKFKAYQGTYICLPPEDIEKDFIEGTNHSMLRDTSLLVSLAVALDRGWTIDCIPAARPKLPQEKTYLAASPHCDLPYMGFELHRWGSYNTWCGLGRSLYEEIRDTLTSVFQMEETQIGLFTKGDKSPKGIVCLPPHAIVVIASTVPFSYNIMESLSKLLDPLEKYERLNRSASVVQEFRISDIDIEYRLGGYMKLSMKSLIDELSLVMNSHGMAGDITCSKLDENLIEAGMLIEQASRKCRFDIAYDVSNMVYRPKDLSDLLTTLCETRNRCLKWRRHATRKVYKIGAMTDASYMPLEECNVHTGQVYTINDNAISAYSLGAIRRCNNCNKAETIAVTQSGKRLSYIQEILDALGIHSYKEVTTDSLSTVDLLESNDIVNSKAEAIRDEYLDGNLRFTYIHSRDNFADLLTKPVWGHHRDFLLETFFES